MLKSKIIEKYKKASHRLILLDYDGTLVKHQPLPDLAIPSERVFEVLKKLASCEAKVVIVTGRGPADIDKIIGHLPLYIIAEHGVMSKANGTWEKKFDVYNEWKRNVLPLLNQITLTCPNSFVEEKHFSLAWHYRNVEPVNAYLHSRELIRLLQSSVQLHGLRVIDGNKVIEVTPAQIGKGKAIQALIEQHNYDFILCIGDDKTDEDMFQYLHKFSSAITIKVGRGESAAKHKFDSVNDVIGLLEQLVSYCDGPPPLVT
jgi:trehalose 6-phosphate synthase/phosphatase